MIEFIKNNYLYLIIGVVVIIGIILLIKILKKKKKVKIVVDETYLNNVTNALGGFDNIINTQIEHKRVRVFLNDIKKIDTSILNSLKIPASIKGKEIKLLLKEEPDSVKIFLDKKGEI